jgi:hypothetical protein
MPEVRAAAGAGTVEGRLYVAGGVGPEGLATSTLVFDPSLGEWSMVAGLPTPREHLGVASDGRRLYVVGGRTGGIGSNLDAAEAFDPTSAEWEVLPPVPTARGGSSAAAAAGLVVLAGGEEQGGTFDEVEAHDAAAGEWVTLSPLPTPRHGLGVAAVGSVVYVIAGGPAPGLAFSAANEALDLRTLADTTESST